VRDFRTLLKGWTPRRPFIQCRTWFTFGANCRKLDRYAGATFDGQRILTQLFDQAGLMLVDFINGVWSVQG